MRGEAEEEVLRGEPRRALLPDPGAANGRAPPQVPRGAAASAKGRFRQIPAPPADGWRGRLAEGNGLHRPRLKAAEARPGGADPRA